jgi:hypothetical protein
MIGDPAAVLEPRSARLERLEPYIASAQGPLSCERIVESFVRHHDMLESRRPVPLATHAMAWAQVAVDALADRTWERRYNRHIFPPLSPATVSRAIAGYQRALGRFGGVRVSMLGPALFRLEPG